MKLARRVPPSILRKAYSRPRYNLTEIPLLFPEDTPIQIELELILALENMVNTTATTLKSNRLIRQLIRKLKRIHQAPKLCRGIDGYSFCSTRNPIVAGMAAHDFDDLLAIINGMIKSPPPDWNARAWLINWLFRPVPALGGKTPVSVFNSPMGKEKVKKVLLCMGSGAYL